MGNPAEMSDEALAMHRIADQLAALVAELRKVRMCRAEYRTFAEGE